MTAAPVLLATDRTDVDPRLFSLAVAVAQLRETTVDLLHVVPEVAPVVDAIAGDVQAAQAEARQYDETRFAELRARLNETFAGTPAAQIGACFVEAGRPWEAIIAHAERRTPSMIVVGTHTEPPAGRAVLERILGTTADRVVRMARCPVLVATGTGPIRPRLQGATAVVGVDFSEASVAATRLARDLLEAAEGSLVLVHTALPSGGEQVPPDKKTWQHLLREQSRRESEEKLQAFATIHAPGARTTQRLTPDLPSVDLCTAARELEADLLVVGTRGLGALRQMLVGSTTERCLRLSSIPVLVTKEDA